MIQVYIDGASAGNPGPAGAGIFIKDGSQQLREYYPLPVMTNHEAEFHACLKALQRCKEEGYPLLSIRSDAKVVVEAIEKRYSGNVLFQELLQEILTLIDSSFDHVFIKWIPAKQNGEADKLAKQAVQTSRKKTKD